MPGKAKGQHKEKQLSAAFVRSVNEPGRYVDGNGLFLQVDRSGAKRWTQRLMVRGKRRDIGLGPFTHDPSKSPGLTLAQARERAVANRAKARAGGDPLAEKRASQVRPMTFSECVAAYAQAKLSEFRSEKHRKQWLSALERLALPELGKLPVQDIGTRDVLRMLEPHWRERTITAKKLRGQVEAVLTWATVSGHREGDNPAAWRGNLKELLPAPSKVARPQHHPALAQSDAGAWWAALAQREGISARALEFVALTAARSGEVRGMTWDEVDLSAGIWAVPADRMKASREHRVPLTAPALAILEALPRMKGSPYVFPAPRGGMLSDMTISAVMRRMQEAEERAGRPGYLDPQTKRPAVPHGLRSTFRQWTAEKGYPRDMAEIALAHQVGTDVERAYQRSDMLDRRRHMMADWAGFLRGESGAKVVPLRA
jgi:integrase